MTGLRVRYQKVRQFVARAIETRIHEAESRGLEGSNPVCSASQAGFCGSCPETRRKRGLQINLQMLTDGRLELAPCWFEQQRMFAGV